MSEKKRVKYLRWGLLALFTGFITIAAYSHTNESGIFPSIHAICPFGGLESLYSIFTTGTFIQKILSGTLILFAITVVLAIMFRRSFCGLLCPFGAIQEFFAAIGKRLLKRRWLMPASIDRPLRYLKYVILLITVVYAWKTAGLWVAPYDPWSSYAHLPEGLSSVWSESAIGLILLVITVVGSILYDRFFCKYLCPMGALYGIIGKLSPHRVKREKSLCIDCGLCNKACPVNLDVQHADEVKSAECLNCQLCVLSCPKEGALVLKQGKKNRKPAVVIVMVFVLFFGSILSFKAMGLYQVTPAKVAAGELIRISELKGYMTIQEAAEATKMNEPAFYQRMEIPATVPNTTKMKEIKNLVPDYSFDEMKSKIE